MPPGVPWGALGATWELLAGPWDSLGVVWLLVVISALLARLVSRYSLLRVSLSVCCFHSSARKMLSLAIL